MAGLIPKPDDEEMERHPLAVVEGMRDLRIVQGAAQAFQQRDQSGHHVRPATLGGIEPAIGTLFNLAQGDQFMSGGHSWQVSYQGDAGTGSFTGGNDLALQTFPEPSTALLVTTGFCAVAFSRRRRRYSLFEH